jgi:hypothetical protein
VTHGPHDACTRLMTIPRPCRWVAFVITPQFPEGLRRICQKHVLADPIPPLPMAIPHAGQPVVDAVPRSATGHEPLYHRPEWLGHDWAQDLWIA